MPAVVHRENVGNPPQFLPAHLLDISRDAERHVDGVHARLVRRYLVVFRLDFASCTVVALPRERTCAFLNQFN